MTETTDRIATVCSHLGLFALGTSFGVRMVGSKISALCQPTVFVEAPCAPIVESLRAVDSAAMVGGAVLVLAAVAVTLPQWRSSAEEAA